METIIIEKDIRVMYEEAVSFPEGINAAHQKLESLFPFSEERKYFGISRPENGVTVYKAAVEELTPDESNDFNLPTMIIKKGTYISVTIQDFMKNIPAIGRTFQELITHPDIDPEGYCVEWYFNLNDVRCMVPLKP